MSEYDLDEQGRVVTTQTVHGSTLAVIEKKARQQLRAFFVHHPFDIVEIRARPETMLGGEVAYWEAEVEARMRSKRASEA